MLKQTVRNYTFNIQVGRKSYCLRAKIQGKIMEQELAGTMQIYTLYSNS